MSCHHSQLIALIVILVIISGCDSKPDVLKEQTQTSEYLRSFGQILEEYKRDMPALQDKVAMDVAEFNRLEKQNTIAARLSLAHTMDQLLERIIPFSSKIEKLTPPDKLREHKAVNLECANTQAEFIKKMAEALRNQDRRIYESQMERYELYVRGCNDRIEGSLRKAGYTSPEDISKAIEAGQ